MSEQWINYNFKDEFQPEVPEGHAKASGPCLRVALFMGGYDTDLPAWTKQQDVPAICQRLGLKFHSAPGETVVLNKRRPCIIGKVTDRQEKNTIGHWFYSKNPEEDLANVQSKDLFAIIELPKHKRFSIAANRIINIFNRYLKK